MKIIVAGATGAIGRQLLPLLVHAGHEVIGTTRYPAKTGDITAMGARPMVLDALDRESVLAALSDVQPDVVIHQLTDLATHNWAGNSRLRIEGTRHLVAAAQAVGVQRMIAQSISWVCAPGEGLSREDDPLDVDADLSRINTIRGVQGLEQAVSEMPIGVVLRYGMLYGPHTWYSRGEDTLVTDPLMKGETAARDAESSFVHVTDAAQASLLALDWPAGIYNIVDDEPALETERMPVFASLLGAPQPLVATGKKPWERGASNARARQQGWRPLYPSWREGFKAVLG